MGQTPIILQLILKTWSVHYLLSKYIDKGVPQCLAVHVQDTNTGHAFL
jgi:hypothetical protein